MKTPELAIGYGYVIADDDGRIQLDTLRSNRTACWDAFGSKSFIDDPKAKKAHYKKLGFRCVSVWVREHVALRRR